MSSSLVRRQGSSQMFRQGIAIVSYVQNLPHIKQQQALLASMLRHACIFTRTHVCMHKSSHQAAAGSACMFAHRWAPLHHPHQAAAGSACMHAHRQAPLHHSHQVAAGRAPQTEPWQGPRACAIHR
eukprot:375270-Pelagomonas_calceolata.AAC.6